MKGKTHKFGDSINTDYIISGRYKFRIQDPRELASHIMEDLRPNFYESIKKGDFIVAGENFGCGSSREQAPQAIKASGIQAVLAKTFARIFYRNAFNIGLPLVECDTDSIDEGDILDVDLDKSRIINLTKDAEVRMSPVSPTMLEILKDGGIINHFKKHKGFKV